MVFGFRRFQGGQKRRLSVVKRDPAFQQLQMRLERCVNVGKVAQSSVKCGGGIFDHFLASHSHFVQFIRQALGLLLRLRQEFCEGGDVMIIYVIYPLGKAHFCRFIDPCRDNSVLDQYIVNILHTLFHLHHSLPDPLLTQ